MQKVFYNILLPVSLGKETGAVIEKAVAFANVLECNLHLVCVLPPAPAWKDLLGLKRPVTSTGSEKLKMLHRKYLQKMRPGTLMFAECTTGNAAEEITRYALAHHIDMIYFDGSMNRFNNLPLNLQRSPDLHCCLLVDALPGSTGTPESIVLPIDHHLSVNLIRVAIFMAQQLGATIHLVSAETDTRNTKNLLYLKKAYQVLKDNTSIQIVCSTLTGTETEQSMLHYAASVPAGLIVSPMNTSPRQASLLQKLLPGDWFQKPRIPVMLVD